MEARDPPPLTSLTPTIATGTATSRDSNRAQGIVRSSVPVIHPAQGTSQDTAIGQPTEKTFPANPGLKKFKSGGQQWYTVNGTLQARPYSLKEGAGVDRETKGNTVRSVVLSRRNPDSPVLRKTTNTAKSIFPWNAAKTEDLVRTTNLLAELAAKDSLLRDHLAVEVVTKVEGDVISFITPKADFTLREFINNPHKYPELKEDLQVKLEELRAVPERLAQYCITHGDISPKNIMFRRETGKFILIDTAQATNFSDKPERLPMFLTIDSKSLDLAIEEALMANSGTPQPQQFLYF